MKFPFFGTCLMKRPISKVSLPTAWQVPILADAAMAGSETADGRLIPVLILDTTRHPKLAELIRIHEQLGPGDVRFAWGIKKGLKDAMLIVEFERPIEVQSVFVFDIAKYAGLVELMMASGGVYLQAGSPGDRLTSTLDNPRILVELPDTGFRPVWEEVLLKRMAAVIRAQSGMSRAAAKGAAALYVKEVRKVPRFHTR